MRTRALKGKTSRPEAGLNVHFPRWSTNLTPHQLMPANAELVERPPVSNVLPRFAHDFSHLPVRSPSSPSVQAAAPRISSPEDTCELEADRVAEHVMGISDPLLQPVHDCSGRTQSPLSDQEHARLSTGGVWSGDVVPSAVLPNVKEELGSSGDPLEPVTRDVMEQRFGHDFSQVRVHIGAKAAESAQALGAHAYTVARDIVFGAAQYAPHTTNGRALLAHELAHVIQPNAGVALRRRSTKDDKGRKSDAWLAGLAQRPQEAHQAWKGLTSLQKVAVVVQMTKRYGDSFAKSFLQYAEHPVKTVDQAYVPGSAEQTPGWFQARGYQLWKRSSVNEFWVHPSGKEIMNVLGQPRNVLTPISSHPVAPALEDSSALADTTSSILRDTLAAETAVRQDLEDRKRRLEKANKTTDDYVEQYEQYTHSLEAMKARLEAAVEDIDILRQQLEGTNSRTVSTIDGQIRELLDLQIWADIESSTMGMQFLEPLNVQLMNPVDDEAADGAE